MFKLVKQVVRQNPLLVPCWDHFPWPGGLSKDPTVGLDGRTPPISQIISLTNSLFYTLTRFFFLCLNYLSIGEPSSEWVTSLWCCSHWLKHRLDSQALLWRRQKVILMIWTQCCKTFNYSNLQIFKISYMTQKFGNTHP